MKPALLTVMDVPCAGTDAKRDAAIREWMNAVGERWSDLHDWVPKNN